METKTKKNKVYTAEGDPDYGCIYIAAKNGKCARTFAQGTYIMDHIDRYIDLQVRRHWGIKETDFEGVLDIFQMEQLGLLWFGCPFCDSEELLVITPQECKCETCEKVFDIPYLP